MAAQDALQMFGIIEHGQPVGVVSLASLATTLDQPDRCSTQLIYLNGCSSCRACRMQRQPCSRTTHPCGKHETARNGYTCAVVAQQVRTTWVGTCPMPSNNARNTQLTRSGVLSALSLRRNTITPMTPGRLLRQLRLCGGPPCTRLPRFTVLKRVVLQSEPLGGLRQDTVVLWCNLVFTWSGGLQLCRVSVS